MLVKNIHELINQGEGLTLEFKKSREQLPDNLFETICAFLNRNGGIVLLGVLDDGAIEGINPSVAEALCKNIVNLSNNPQKLYPTFLLDAHVITYQHKILITIYVPMSSQVHKSSGKIYDRSSDGDFELKSDEQIKQLYNRKSILFTENKIYPFLEENHFVTGIVERTRRIIKINRPDHPWNELSDTQFLLPLDYFEPT
ncbi:MAG: RNA-binding domain-containing protein [Bacteroidota bacterium]